MCIFGNKSNIVDIVILDEHESIRGFRNWKVIRDPLDKKDKLQSLNFPYIWQPRGIASGNPTEDNFEGIYNFNYNYNSNDNYHPRYDYDYIEYYYGTTRNWGKIIEYADGFRAQFSRIEFLTKSDRQVEEIAKFYNVPCIFVDEII